MLLSHLSPLVGSLLSHSPGELPPYAIASHQKHFKIIKIFTIICGRRGKYFVKLSSEGFGMLAATGTVCIYSYGRRLCI